MRHHVIQEHLPAGFAGTDMELAERMASLEQFLQVVRGQFKCCDNGELTNKVLKDHIYPDTMGMTIHESEEVCRSLQYLLVYPEATTQIENKHLPVTSGKYSKY